jgi:hypothetical protein
MIPKGMVQRAAPGKTAPEVAAPGKAAPEAAVPGKAVPEAAAPGKTLPEGTVPVKGTVPRAAVLGADTIPAAKPDLKRRALVRAHKKS